MRQDLRIGRLLPLVVSAFVVTALLTPVSAMLGGTIAGLVTDSNGSVAGIEVCAESDSVSYSDCDTTAANGTYSIHSLSPASDYVVLFQDTTTPADHVSEFYDDVGFSEFENATLVSVTEGNTTDKIDAVLEITGRISGTVTDASGPVAGEFVCAQSSSVFTAGCDTTVANGTYTIEGLAPANDYTVTFIDFTNTYVDEFYNNVTSSGSATLVTVTSGPGTQGINALLGTGGTISGTITDGSGPVSGATVTALSSFVETGAVRTATTAANGTYVIGGVQQTINYSVFVESPPGAPNHVSEWYNDAYSYDAATKFIVIDGLNRPDIDVQLGLGGSISGSVTDVDGPLDPAAFVSVCAESSSTEPGCAEVLANGTYTIAGLAPATDYRVRTSSQRHSSEFYDDTFDPNLATVFTVTEGSSATNVDFVLDFKRAFHLLSQACTVLDVGPIPVGYDRSFSVSGVIHPSQNPSPPSCPIPAEADAVFANVIIENPSAPGNLRLTASGTVPTGGILNFAANGLDNSNAQSVPISLPFQVLNISTNSPPGVTGVLADGVKVEILGWYERSELTGLAFIPQAPCAILDTRSEFGGAGLFAGPITTNTTLTVGLAGSFSASQGGGNTTCGVEGGLSSPAAALVNVVLVRSNGEASVESTATGATIVNNQTLAPPMNNASAVVLPVDTNGRIDLSVLVAPGSDTEVRAVLLGIYLDQAGQGAFVGFEYEPLTPCATFDTRTQFGAASTFAGARLGDETTTYDVTGSFDPAQGGDNSDCGVPEGVVAVELNLVAVAAQRSGNLQAAALGDPPTGGVLNFSSLAVPMNNSNAIVLPVSSDGKITVTVNGGASGVGLPVTDIRGVITGYYR